MSSSFSNEQLTNVLSYWQAIEAFDCSLHETGNMHATGSKSQSSKETCGSIDNGIVSGLIERSIELNRGGLDIELEIERVKASVLVNRLFELANVEADLNPNEDNKSAALISYQVKPRCPNDRIEDYALTNPRVSPIFCLIAHSTASPRLSKFDFSDIEASCSDVGKSIQDSVFGVKSDILVKDMTKPHLKLMAEKLEAILGITCDSDNIQHDIFVTPSQRSSDNQFSNFAKDLKALHCAVGLGGLEYVTP